MTTITKDAANMAEIIGELGLNIAEAQKELNAGYIDALVKLLDVAKHATDESNVAKVLASISPPNYQYSRTTLEFAADMSRRTDTSTSLGGNVSFGSVSIQGGFSSATGEDYRASVRITTQMDALPSSEFGQRLVESVTDFTTPALPSPASKADEKITKATTALISGFGGTVPTG